MAAGGGHSTVGDLLPVAQGSESARHLILEHMDESSRGQNHHVLLEMSVPELNAWANRRRSPTVE